MTPEIENTYCCLLSGFVVEVEVVGDLREFRANWYRPLTLIGNPKKEIQHLLTPSHLTHVSLFAKQE